MSEEERERLMKARIKEVLERLHPNKAGVAMYLAGLEEAYEPGDYEGATDEEIEADYQLYREYCIDYLLPDEW